MTVNYGPNEMYDDHHAHDYVVVAYEKRIKLFEDHGKYPRDDYSINLLKRAQRAEVLDEPPFFEHFTPMDRFGLWGVLDFLD